MILPPYNSFRDRFWGADYPRVRIIYGELGHRCHSGTCTILHCLLSVNILIDRST